MANPCPLCEKLARIRAGARDPSLVAELPETFVMLAEDQRYEGWCLLALKDHEEHLEALPVERQAAIFRDVARVGKAIQAAFGPDRLNLECLGNLLAHVHWHVIPRYRAWDPDPSNTIWVRPAQERAVGCAPARRDELVARVCAALAEVRV